jgi:ELWxxDGT repeat protein
MLLRPFANLLRRLRDFFGRTKRVATRFSLGEQLEGRVLLSIDAVQVADISPGNNDSSPQNLTNVNGVLYFSADDGTHGSELWKSDGTAAGTSMVADMNSGSAASNPDYLTNVNGTLYFTADDGIHGKELWKSDGTSAGTVLVKDINPGSSDSAPGYLTNFNGTLYFQAKTASSGVELWKSDGTDAGTVLVKDISSGTHDSNPAELTPIGNTLFFTANDGVTGYELWKTDGTTAGTALVKDIFPGTDPSAGGPNSSAPISLINVNGTLYFTAEHSADSYDLWKSDGTSAGTVLVKDVASASGGYSPNYLTNVNGTIYFSAFDANGGGELWKSNGTASGTVRVKDFKNNDYYGVTNLTALNGTLYFSAGDNGGAAELWKSNGTAAGTSLVKNLYPGVTDSYLSALTSVNGVLYFIADNGATGQELWQSDGTTAGTVVVKDIVPGTNGSYPDSLTNVNGVLYFTARTPDAGQELWHLTAGNAAPTNISLSSMTVSDHNTANAVLGTLSATDPNSSETFTYSLVSGTGSTDNSSFSITGNTLKIIPVSNSAVQSSYSVRIRVTDHGGLTFEKQFTITVTQAGQSTAPAITLNSQTLVYHVASRKAAAIDGSATLAVGSNPALTFSGAMLQVTGQGGKDTLSILKQGGITTKGKNVLSGKTVIGTFSGGKKSAALTVHFTAAATQDMVQTVIRDIGFKSTDKVAGTRNVKMQITKSGGPNTNLATRQIQVGP